MRLWLVLGVALHPAGKTVGNFVGVADLTLSVTSGSRKATESVAGRRRPLPTALRCDWTGARFGAKR